MSKLNGIQKLKNNVHRSSFDLSFRNAYTAKVGEILPICVKEVLPGDKFKLDLSQFTRTQPLQTAAFTRFKEYFDVFFVPYRLLWRHFPDTLAQTGQSLSASANGSMTPVGTALPWITYGDIRRLCQGTSVDSFGFTTGYKATKLCTLLGYPYLGTSTATLSDTMKLNPFRLFAYQKICQDYYRNDQWVKPSPWLYNIDYVNTASALTLNYECFTLKYALFPKDSFLGVLPSPQFGSTASLDTDVSSNTDNLFHLFNESMKGGGSITGTSSQSGSSTTLTSPHFNPKTSVPFTLGQKLSILQLRAADALQKYREITQSNKYDYMNQVEAHFGVKPNRVYSGLCEFLDGWDSDFQINPQINTNLTGENEATISATGTGQSSFNGTYDFNEHGIFMVMYHMAPRLDWQDMYLDPHNEKVDVKDFAQPEFDSLGMQPFYGRNFCAASSSTMSNPNTLVFGYRPRYMEYKSSVDTVHGAFNDSLKSWCCYLDRDYIMKLYDYSHNRPSWSPDIFKINPHIVDSIFGVNADSTVNTDQLLCNANIGLYAVRNLDFNGLPY